jgi:hypothetical protein
MRVRGEEGKRVRGCEGLIVSFALLLPFNEELFIIELLIYSLIVPESIGDVIYIYNFISTTLLPSHPLTLSTSQT